MEERVFTGEKAGLRTDWKRGGGLRKDALIKKFHIRTTTDINDMIIALDMASDDEDDEVDDEGDEAQPAAGDEDLEELTFEDIIEIRDNDDLDEVEDDE